MIPRERERKGKKKKKKRDREGNGRRDARTCAKRDSENLKWREEDRDRREWAWPVS